MPLNLLPLPIGIVLVESGECLVRFGLRTIVDAFRDAIAAALAAAIVDLNAFIPSALPMQALGMKAFPTFDTN
jgi:hypothetical protein